jgi:GH15 family glucan-1,4-alpha-glucosidase
LQKDIPYMQTLEDDDGWVFAKLGFNQSKFSLTIVDTKPQYASILAHDKTLPQFEMHLPDSNFVNSLDAQITNLMMGYIGRQTGPGEPVNYPLAWERDGAYSLQTMAKSGNLQTAKELSYYFAENDFFGGFGAEGDAPGSEINALTEVAFLLNDTAYYNYVWPHIKRKLGYIDEMMHADGNVYKNFIGPLAPQIAHDLPRRQLICKKFEDGLIQGTMDGHFPALYITAISYRGLMQASRLAKLFHEDSLANACIAKANTLQ